jgi:hypothetical protein
MLKLCIYYHYRAAPTVFPKLPEWPADILITRWCFNLNTTEAEGGVPWLS